MHARSPQPNIRRRDAASRYPAIFWLIVVLTGVGGGLGAGLLMHVLYGMQHLCWSYESGGFIEAVKRATAGRRVLVLLCAGLFAGIARWLLNLSTGGHGGEICETIWFHAGKFPGMRTLARAVLSVSVVGMGVSLGREGALKQAGAVVASKLSQWASLSPSQCRLLAACGAGAGMAAAYNVPFGGALFALEVLLGDLTLPLVVPALATSFIATGVSWSLLPNQPTYNVPTYGLSLSQIIWAVIMGPLVALTSVLYIRLIGWADARKPHGWFTVVAPVFTFTGLGLVAIAFPQLLGNGKGVVQLAFTNELGLKLLLALPVLKALATASSLASGTPGGLFTPTLTCGAVLGGLLGHAWGYLWPGAPPGSYAVVGAGAFLAAATQGPISSVVLVLELTRWVDPLMVPLLVAVVGTTLLSRYLEPRSIYSARVHWDERSASLPAATLSTAFDNLLTHNFEIVSAATRYTDIVGPLLRLGPKRTPLYVVDERGQLIGELTSLCVVRKAKLAMPLQAATASDLAVPVSPLSFSMSAEAVRQRVRESAVDHLPAIGPDGRLVGVVWQAR
jgi:CIC family chloride channel protein